MGSRFQTASWRLRELETSQVASMQLKKWYSAKVKLMSMAMAVIMVKRSPRDT